MRISHSNGVELVPVHKRLSLPIANHLFITKTRIAQLVTREGLMFYLPNEQIKEELRKAFCSMEDVLDDSTRQVEELTGIKRNGNKLVYYVARVDQCPSITGIKKDGDMKALASEI